MSPAPNLDRFLLAQQTTYGTALAEIRQGRKKSHWMWFIFPQLQGLGYSANAQYYGISGLAEAQAFLQHPILAPRLQEISTALLQLPSNNATQVFGSPDDLKLHSSMTLFAIAGGGIFQAILDKFFQGNHDPATLKILSSTDTNKK